LHAPTLSKVWYPKYGIQSMVSKVWYPKYGIQGGAERPKKSLLLPEPQRRRHVVQSSQELTITESLEQRPGLLKLSAVARPLSHHDAHARRMRDHPVRLSVLDGLRQPCLVTVSQRLGDRGAAVQGVVAPRHWVRGKQVKQRSWQQQAPLTQEHGREDHDPEPEIGVHISQAGDGLHGRLQWCGIIAP